MDNEGQNELSDDEGVAPADDKKLIPEWNVHADDQIVLVAFLALLLILGTFAWRSFFGGSDELGPASDLVAANGGEGSDVADAGLDLVEESYGIKARLSGTTAVLTGGVASEADRVAAGKQALAVPGVTDVDNRLQLSNENTEVADDADADGDVGATGSGDGDGDGDEESTLTSTTTSPPSTTSTAPVVGAAEAQVTATAESIVLAGTVPSEEAAEELRQAAAAAYPEEQVVDQLTIVEGADPYNISLSGTTPSQASLEALTAAVGASSGNVSGELGVDTGFAVTAELNELFGLEPILFGSGTAEILADSVPTLDRAAEILTANPDVEIEVGGHTDSRGADDTNLELSQLRAEAVVDALRDRGVANELTAVGYGETQLLEEPDETPEQQQANRRIEFKAL